MRRARSRARTLAAVGEHAWIRALLGRLPPAGGRVLVGPGDDCAVLSTRGRPVVLTVDALVEGTHFRLGWESPAALGRRALRVNVSDLAAMAAEPLAALVAVEAPPALPRAVLDGVMRGLAADARRLGIAVVGGNVAAGSHLALTVTLVGEAPGRVLTRGGARPGDLLFVTWTLGGAAAAVRALVAGWAAARPPVPVRLAVARRLAPLASAAIDVSDGLLQDLGHVCRASGVAAEVDAARVPVAAGCRRALGAVALDVALTGGEDYELLVAVPARRAARLRVPGSRLTCVGRVVAGRPAVRVLDAAGRPLVPRQAGFDHFG